MAEHGEEQCEEDDESRRLLHRLFGKHEEAVKHQDQYGQGEEDVGDQAAALLKEKRSHRKSSTAVASPIGQCNAGLDMAGVEVEVFEVGIFELSFLSRGRDTFKKG